MAVSGASATVKRITKDLGIDELYGTAQVLELELEGERTELAGWQEQYNRGKDLADDRKATLLAEVSRNNEGKSESFIERTHKILLAEDEMYGGYLGTYRDAKDRIQDSEAKIRVLETRIRTIQSQLNMFAGALQAAAAQNRAKTTANLLSVQAGVLASADL